MPLSDSERLRYLQLKKRSAESLNIKPEDTSYLSNQLSPGTEPGEPSFFQGVKAGLTAQPGEGVGHFIGAAIPAGVGAAVGGPIGAALGETVRQGAGAVVNPEATAKKSPLAIGAEVSFAGASQKVGEMAGPYIGKGIAKTGEAVKTVTDWLSSKIGKSFLKASKSINAYGHEPERAIIDEGIIATSWDDLILKAKAAKHDLGDMFTEVFNRADNPKSVKLGMEITSPVESALKEAEKFPTENAGLIERLKGLRNDVNYQINITKSKMRKQISPEKANSIKQSLYRVTKYTGTASDDALMNKTKQDVARNISNKISEAVPDIEPLNSRYGNLIALENAATNRAIVAERADMFGLPEMFATGIAGVGGIMGSAAGLAPAAGLVLASRGLKMPLGATTAMQASSTIGKLLTKPQIASLAVKLSEKSGGALSVPIIEDMIESEQDEKDK